MPMCRVRLVVDLHSLMRSVEGCSSGMSLGLCRGHAALFLLDGAKPTPKLLLLQLQSSLLYQSPAPHWQSVQLHDKEQHYGCQHNSCNKQTVYTPVCAGRSCVQPLFCVLQSERWHCFANLSRVRHAAAFELRRPSVLYWDCAVNCIDSNRRDGHVAM